MLLPAAVLAFAHATLYATNTLPSTTTPPGQTPTYPPRLQPGIVFHYHLAPFIIYGNPCPYRCPTVLLGCVKKTSNGMTFL